MNSITIVVIIHLISYYGVDGFCEVLCLAITNQGSPRVKIGCAKKMLGFPFNL